MGGVARVDVALHEAFPDAPIYTSVYEPDELARQHFEGLDIRTTWLQKLPRPLRKLQRLFPMLRVKAFRDLDLSAYDIIISSSSAESKQVRKSGPDQIHICYCHTPIRYYWGYTEQYLANPGFGWLNWPARIGLKLLLPSLKKADYQAAQQVDYFIANSSEVRDRIHKYYGKDSVVINPPVDTEGFTPYALPLDQRTGYLAHGRQVPYKRVDLAVRACTELGLPLTVSGSGPEHDSLVGMAGPSVRFVTGASDEEVAKLFGSARAYLFPALEDFGIVQVEALAAGTPVIGYREGGTQDIIRDGIDGCWFDEQTPESLMSVLQDFDQNNFDETNIRGRAKLFDKSSFISKITEFVTSHSK